MELKGMRQAAGVRYATALWELTKAYIELAALDRVAAPRMHDIRTFSGTPTHIDLSLLHPQFTPDRPALLDPIKARAEVLDRKFSGPG